MQILDQAIVTYQGQWEASNGTLVGGGLGAKNANDVMKDVSAALLASGLLIKDSSNTAGFFQSHSLPFFGASQAPFNVTLTLQVNNGLGYGSEDDLLGVINNAVFQDTGRNPVASTIPLVQNPGLVAQPTGQPSQVQPNQQNVSLWDSIKALFKDTTFVTAGIGVGLIVAVLMIASPQGRIIRRQR